MCNDYIPFTGGYVRSNPYEITEYVYRQSYYEEPYYEMGIVFRDMDAYDALLHFLQSLNQSLNLRHLYKITSRWAKVNKINARIETSYRLIADAVKDFIDWVNKQPSTKTSNEFIFKYGPADAFVLGQVGELKIDSQGIEFTCNVGRRNGKSMASKDLMDALVYGNYAKKDADITKEMVNNMIGFKLCPVPKKIIFSGPKCIVLWVDGTKTIVSCSENDQWDEYAAYCAALAKKLYGTTSAVHRMVGKKSNAKEYREAQEVSAHIDGKHSLGNALAEAMYKAMEPFMKEDNDEHPEH